MSPWEQISTLADVCSPETERLYILPFNVYDKDERPGAGCPRGSNWMSKVICFHASPGPDDSGCLKQYVHPQQQKLSLGFSSSTLLQTSAVSACSYVPGQVFNSLTCPIQGLPRRKLPEYPQHPTSLMPAACVCPVNRHKL